MFVFLAGNGVSPLVIEQVAERAVGVYMPVGIRFDFGLPPDPFVRTPEVGTVHFPVRSNGEGTLGVALGGNSRIGEVQCSVSCRNSLGDVAGQSRMPVLIRMDGQVALLKIRPQQKSEFDRLRDNFRVDSQ